MKIQKNKDCNRNTFHIVCKINVFVEMKIQKNKDCNKKHTAKPITMAARRNANPEKQGLQQYSTFYLHDFFNCRNENPEK